MNTLCQCHGEPMYIGLRRGGRIYRKCRVKKRESSKRQSAAFRSQLNAKMLEMRSHPCVDCGQSFPPHVMEFDHCRGEKRFNLSAARNWSEFREEAVKVDAVCANCHCERTFQRGRDVQL